MRSTVHLRLETLARLSAPTRVAATPRDSPSDAKLGFSAPADPERKKKKNPPKTLECTDNFDNSRVLRREVHCNGPNVPANCEFKSVSAKKSPEGNVTNTSTQKERRGDRRRKRQPERETSMTRPEPTQHMGHGHKEHANARTGMNARVCGVLCAAHTVHTESKHKSRAKSQQSCPDAPCVSGQNEKDIMKPHTCHSGEAKSFLWIHDDTRWRPPLLEVSLLRLPQLLAPQRFGLTETQKPARTVAGPLSGAVKPADRQAMPTNKSARRQPPDSVQRGQRSTGKTLS